MTFKEMKQLMLKHFDDMLDGQVNPTLYEVEADKDELWATWLNGFTLGKNVIFRKRTEHDCSCCRHFIKRYGNIVTIKDDKVISIWDFDTNDDKYQHPIEAMRNYIHSKPIVDVFCVERKFVSSNNIVGTACNFEGVGSDVIRWDHFSLNMPNKFILEPSSRKTKGEFQGEMRDTRNVFKRSLDEISVDALEIVLDLISQKSLYRGEEWEKVLRSFLEHKHRYGILSNDKKDIYAWKYSIAAGPVIGRIRNHSIGTLLVNLTEGMDLDAAVSKYEAIVAPSNYKRPKALYTKKMLDDAKAAITELGYMSSLGRRYATVDDITVNNILFSNKNITRKVDSGDIFDEMAADVSVNPKKFANIGEVSIEEFLANILPYAQSVDILLESRHADNMVSLIAPKDKDSKPMFKWNNGFSWAYSGNMTDSMKERVQAAGGKVDGDLRFSIQWNEDGTDNCDLDAHCGEDMIRNEIYFRNKHSYQTGGTLDVDIVRPKGKVAVENITWATRKRMLDGDYIFAVHQYSGSAQKGFRAEIEFDGQIFSYDYDKPMHTHEMIKVAIVTLKNGEFSIKELLPSNMSTRDVWGLKTNQFVPVTTIMLSPNYWDEQKGIGNKHYFFMLKDCVNPENPNGFYNEFLTNELDKYKHVMEALGSKLAVASADDQLSGVGFSSTKRNNVIVKVKGNYEQTLRVIF